MSEHRIKRTLEVAERVSDIIGGNKEKCFVIGASALAAHGYSRQSVDLDLATHLHPHEVLPRLGNLIRELGFAVEVIFAELLIVLKLYAGDLQSISDIRKLLEANTSIDLEKVADLSSEAGLEKEWNAVRS